MAGSGKGRTAVAETTGQSKEVEWHGLTLELPAQVPGTTLWDYAEIELGEKSLGPVMRVLHTMLGDEQNQQVKALVAEKGWNLDQTAEELLADDGLLETVMGAYGVTAGE